MEQIIQGMKFGTTIDEAYETLKKKFGWDPEELKSFDDQGVRNALEIMDKTHKITSEGYSVWFIEYSQRSPMAGKNPNWEVTVAKNWNTITDHAKSKEAWANGKFNKVPLGHKVVIFLHFADDDQFYFMGIYKVAERNPETMTQTFKICLREYRRLKPF